MTPRAGTGARSLGRRTPSRGVPGVLALLLGLLVSLIPLAPAQADDGDLVVEITNLAPAVVTTGDDLLITGRIHNRTEEELEAPAVRLLLQLHVPSSTEALTSWLDGTSDLNVKALTGWNTAEDAPPIPAGGSVPFTIEIATEGTFSRLSAWGPRGIQVEARTQELVASARTTMLWFPTDPAPRAPAELALLVPLTPTPQEWADALEQGIPVGEVAAPRLLRVLDAVGADASLAIDPALLEQDPPGSEPASLTATAEEVTEAASEPATDPTDEATDGEGDTVEGSSQSALIDRLGSEQRRGDLIALGYADADVSALTGAGGQRLWDDGVARSEGLLAEAGLTVENVVWPAGTLTAAGAEALISDGAEGVVLDAADYAVAPNVHATAFSDAGGLDAILADRLLGDALTSPASNGATGRQATLALSAVLTRSAPQEDSGFLVVLPRDIGSRDLDGLTDQIEALQAAPWFEPATLRSLLGRTGTGAALDLPTQVTSPEQISRTAVGDLLQGREVVATYTAAAGATIEQEFAPLLLTPLSAAFAQDPRLRAELIERAVAATTELSAKIHVEASSDVLLISDGGSVPVTVTNQLPVEASVMVELVPENSRLVAREPVTEVLAPQQATTVRIPITAVANGNVVVDVHVLPQTSDRDLAEPASFAVRVRADWENIGTAVVAGLLAVAFIIGLIRTIRRGGRRAAAE